MASIHPTAIVESGAQLDDNVSVGAYSIVREHVRIGAGSTVGPHCVIEGRTTIGRDNRIFQFCSIGAVPQDKKYAGEPTELLIGDRNEIREFCTFNLGTAPIEQNWKMRLSRPIVVRPSITQCGPMRVPAPMRTPARTML